MSQITEVELSTGTRMPRLGLGVFDMDDATTERAVEVAIASGYRMVDTAAVYFNERAVGRGVRASGVAREDVFVTTKLWNTGHTDPRPSLEKSLDELGLDYVDLYLIHWPDPAQGRYVDAWAGLVELREAGLAREIGVSNFTPAHLSELIAAGLPMPPVNQIELHPLHPQRDARRFHDDHHVLTQAWSPLARGKAFSAEALDAVAARYERSVGQIILRWHLQLGVVPLPKSATPSRIRENAAVFDFELAPDDLELISSLARRDLVDETLYSRFG